MYRVIFALAVCCVIVVVAGEAQAQFIVNGPGGSMGIRNPNGTYTYIYPERLNPWANAAQQGTQQTTPFGNMWVGLDGQVHGNFVDPSTGNVHVKSPGGQQSRTLRQRVQSVPSRRRPIRWGR